nr:amidohydrolase family protein [Muribaculaceae bacterium]
MMKGNLIVINADIWTPVGHSAIKGADMDRLTHIPDSYILICDGRIKEIGSMGDYISDEYEKSEIVDAKDRVVLPGFVDSHTHVIFGGYRAEEFDWRLKGESYMSIMEKGGGIQNTVNATRSASKKELVENALWFANEMMAMGVTTVEAKSGYGLSTESELKMLDAIDELDKLSPLHIVSTFLGAHAVPSEYKGRTDDYVNLMIGEMIPAVQGRARFFDIFTEKNVFEIEDSRRLLEAARNAGFQLKLHADEIVTLGGAELAAEMGAVSADHLL